MDSLNLLISTLKGRTDATATSAVATAQLQLKQLRKKLSAERPLSEQLAKMREQAVKKQNGLERARARLQEAKDAVMAAELELEDVNSQLKALTHQISKEVVPDVCYKLTGAQ
eukprot:1457282-Karenia_brevis.AAC.1